MLEFEAEKIKSRGRFADCRQMSPVSFHKSHGGSFSQITFIDLPEFVGRIAIDGVEKYISVIKRGVPIDPRKTSPKGSPDSPSERRETNRPTARLGSNFVGRDNSKEVRPRRRTAPAPNRGNTMRR